MRTCVYLFVPVRVSIYLCLYVCISICACTCVYLFDAVTYGVFLFNVGIYASCSVFVGYTMRAFFTWKYHKDQRIVNRFKWERSVSLYRQTILHKYFNAWSQYSHLRGHKLVG